MVDIIPVVVLAGQSNAVLGPVSSGLVGALRSQGDAFEFVFTALGGTSLFANAAQDWDTASTGELFDQLIAGINAAIANVTAQGAVAQVSILWMQGEQDILVPSATYQPKLTNFIAAVRAAIGVADARFVLSMIPQASGPRVAQINIDTAVANVDLIETVGLQTADGVHYVDAASYYIAQKFMEIVAPSVPAAPGYHNLLAPLTITGDATNATVIGPRFEGLNFTAPDNRNYTVTTAYGADRIVLGSGKDAVQTGTAADMVWLGGGNDIANTGAGDDVVYGGSGNDTIYSLSLIHI